MCGHPLQHKACLLSWGASGTAPSSYVYYVRKEGTAWLACSPAAEEPPWQLTVSSPAGGSINSLRLHQGGCCAGAEVSRLTGPALCLLRPSSPCLSSPSRRACLSLPSCLTPPHPPPPLPTNPRHAPPHPQGCQEGPSPGCVQPRGGCGAHLRQAHPHGSGPQQQGAQLPGQ